MKFRLLYFDHQISNSESYQDLLNDHFIVTAYTESAIYDEVLQSHKPHGIVLNFNMPATDGLPLHQKILNSEHYNGCPLFFIPSDIAEEMRLKTLEISEIDFLNSQSTKEELKLRVSNKIKLFLQGDTIIDVGNLRLDTYSFNIYINNKLIDLTLIEMRIFSYVIRKMPDAVLKNNLMKEIWGSNTKTGKMNVHLSHLKLKLSDWNHEFKTKKSLFSIVPLQ